MKNTSLTVEDYQALAEFRRNLRRYIRFSEKLVRNAALEPREYQLLLVLKGMPPNLRPRISELAEQLQIQHHSAVELVDRLESRKLVRRHRSTTDKREVLVEVTAGGNEVISEMATLHMEEVLARGPDLIKAVERVLRRNSSAAIDAKKHLVQP